MRKITLTLFLILAMACGQNSLHAQIDSYFAQRMQTVMDSVCGRFHMKGASVAVLVPGGGVWKGTYGLADAAGNKVKEDMLFGIGSNTKTFTSTLILKLQEEGKLSLEDTIGRWIKPHPHIKGSITIRQLLNHTSGLFSYTEHPNLNDSLLSDFERVWQPEELLGFVNKPYSTKPGTSFRYSNTNYILAGLIIKAITKKSYEAAVREYILVPNGLNNTYLIPQETPGGFVAHPWSMGMGAPYLVDGFTVGYSNTAMFSMANSAGGIMSTAEDNARFWHLLSSGKLVNESSWNEMRRWVPAGSGASYGLGIFKYNSVNGRKCYSHGGTIPGYIAENVVDSSSGVCISVLTNQDSLGNDQILNYLVRSLHKVSINAKATDIADAARADIQVDLYPNPAAHVLTVSLPAESVSSTLVMYDLSGRPVLNQSLTAGSSQIDVSRLPAGLYMAHFQSRNGMAVKRVQVSR